MHHHDCVLPTGQAAHKKRAIKKNFNKLKSRFSPGSTFLTWKSAHVARMMDSKLTFIPMIFILECIWGTI
ncbi:unnamed protein product [Pocillopora meandrina]|uniref:Uncharacterized protein n=1 Tax=Pocillopora meandrina TaxID=46732 RepID=A0AAU9VTC4_9CNID|nr:unnamed protein product [Pocillopora meandrina]